MNLPPISMSGFVTESPDAVSPPITPLTSFGVAENLMPGVKLLASGPTSTSLALAFLCAHVLECLLKAFLAREGMSDSELRSQSIRHDLAKLWSEAVARGLHVSAAPPDWVTCLSRLHAPPYFLRYSPHVHAIVSPAAQPMVSELEMILEVVRK
jgi:hypothetical protein